MHSILQINLRAEVDNSDVMKPKPPGENNMESRVQREITSSENNGVRCGNRNQEIQQIQDL